jgi:hypothetical protein
MLIAQIHMSQISSSFSLDDARVTTPGDAGTDIPSPSGTGQVANGTNR